MTSEEIQVLQEHVQYIAKDVQWVSQAFCHKSFSKENNLSSHNEKLEFLGDAVLDLVIADMLMKNFTEDHEGNLSRKRASIVNEDRLYELAMERQLYKFLKLGKAEQKNNLDKNPRLLASAFEALVGAIYKDRGYQVVYTWVEGVFSPLLKLAFASHDFERDYKTRFQEKIQELYKVTPNYLVKGTEGPDHQKIYVMDVFVQGEVWAEGKGSSKKLAAQDAAKKAMEKLPK